MKNKLLSIFCVLSVLSVVSLNANSETIFSGSADLAGISNGNLEKINSNTAQINVNSGTAGATVNWNTLNVPQNNTLNFYFPDANQYALNRVANGLTTIAGNVGYANGSQAGTVIFSNPNGIVCTGTSVINMSGSLLLTTHNINTIDDVNNLMKLSSAADSLGNYHGVTLLPGAQMTLGGNLTIASLGIDMNGANIVSKDTILVTSDGLNYVLANKKNTNDKVSNITSADVQPAAVYYNNNAANPSEYIPGTLGNKVANMAFKTTDGRIIIKSNSSDVIVNSSKFDGDVSIAAKNNVNITSSAKMAGDYVKDTSKGAFIGNVDITAGGDVLLSSVNQSTTVPFYKDLTINTKGDITLKNVRIIEDITQVANLKGKNILISNYNTSSWDWSRMILGDVIADCVDFVAIQTQVFGNSDIKAEESINLLGSLFGEEGLTTKLNAKNITIDKGPVGTSSGYIARVRGLLDAKASESITLANNFKQVSESPDAILEASSITIDNFSLLSVIFKNIDEANIEMKSGAKVYGETQFITTPKAEENVIMQDNVINQTVVQDDNNILSAYIDTLNVGSEPNINIESEIYKVQAFAADDSDYKEEFLRTYVKKDKSGNLYTISSFISK